MTSKSARRGKLTEAERAEIVRLCEEGMTYSAIGARFGVTKQAVCSLLHLRKVSPSPRGLKTAARRHRALAMATAGSSPEEIAFEFDVTPGYARLVLKTDFGFRFPQAARRARDNTEVLRLFAEGRTEKEIAALLGFAPITVSRRLNKAGIRLRRNAPRRHTRAQFAVLAVEAARLRCAGVAISEVADRLRVSISFVNVAVRRISDC